MDERMPTRIREEISVRGVDFFKLAQPAAHGAASSSEPSTLTDPPRSTGGSSRLLRRVLKAVREFVQYTPGALVIYCPESLRHQTFVLEDHWVYIGAPNASGQFNLQREFTFTITGENHYESRVEEYEIDGHQRMAALFPCVDFNYPGRTTERFVSLHGAAKSDRVSIRLFQGRITELDWKEEPISAIEDDHQDG